MHCIRNLLNYNGLKCFLENLQLLMHKLGSLTKFPEHSETRGPSATLYNAIKSGPPASLPRLFVKISQLPLKLTNHAVSVFYVINISCKQPVKDRSGRIF